MSRRMCILLIFAALMSIVVLLAACGGQPPAPTPTQPPAPTPTTAQEQAPTPAEPPTSTPAAQPSPTSTVEATPTFTVEPSPTAVPALNGQTLLGERCTVCHTLDRVKQSRKSEADWKATVERMVRKGAVLSTEEIEAVVRYLAQTYPR